MLSRRQRVRRRARRPAQAMVEVAVLVPMVLLPMIFGLVAVGRILQTQMAVSAVAREAARTGALAARKSDVKPDGEARGYDVSGGYHLTRSALNVNIDPTHFERCGSVTARVTYEVNFGDVPLLQWTHLKIHADDAEPVDGYRSDLPGTC